MSTATRGKWMDACRGGVYPSPVSLQSSSSCRLGTDQIWLQYILQEEQPSMLCSLQMPQF